QAGTKEIRTYSGSPELNPKKTQVSIFRVNRILVQLRRASGAAGCSVDSPDAVIVHALSRPPPRRHASGAVLRLQSTSSSAVLEF
ncbi:MAG: hypothetical protein V3S93_04860, partial [Methyloceanibacter sp.]